MTAEAPSSFRRKVRPGKTLLSATAASSQTTESVRVRWIDDSILLGSTGCGSLVGGVW